MPELYISNSVAIPTITYDKVSSIRMKQKLCTVLVYVFWLTIQVQALQLIAEPTLIESGTTQHLIVNCSVDPETSGKMIFLNSIVLTRSTDDGLGSGVLSISGESYLCMQWEYPIFSMAGEYKCDANGMGLSWQPVTVSSSVNVALKEMSINSVYSRLRNSQLENKQRIYDIGHLAKELKENNVVVETNTKDIKMLQDQLKYTTEFIQDLIEEINEAAIKTLFFESSLYNGHTYFLPKESTLRESSTATFACTKHGGFLAEIEDLEEWRFVNNFLKQYPLYYAVLISGTDEGHEGLWTNSRNNGTVTFLKWSPNEPSEIKGENCLALWRDFDWNMADDVCSLETHKYTLGYLCEK
ncbi:C-type lectin domain family 3 member A-like isoform X2 [Biomphalaria glabrata]|nr:C-type lectin domain family 3 member A-like isoform X2 [Biomphalaria glabrata]